MSIHKAQKWSLGKYLYKRCTFTPQGSSLVPQICILLPNKYRSVSFKKILPQWHLLYLYFRVYSDVVLALEGSSFTSLTSSHTCLNLNMNIVYYTHIHKAVFG